VYRNENGSGQINVK